ncbi:vitamin K epoxide reductase complex subunit 1-like protein 1 [Chelonus insularis]|uniref:vitamin K epoxide reductase complex subunit 1-like protein 1 n=1 Tax=Chelonus insularis TaxID=460826 RepID=UPI00158B747A|nr:vitamin K epoxide reductase complex subunit 1-like protein 1 [Chelonus insularis]
MSVVTRETLKLHRVNAGIIVSCIVGLFLSYYAYIVETSKEQDPDYEAMCDISENISCTKVFMSEYGKGFGVISQNSIFYMPNSIYGLGFYGVIFFLSIFNNYGITFGVVSVACLSNISSIYLGWILYLLNDICVVCIGTYIVNAILLILNYRKLCILSLIKLKKN